MVGNLTILTADDDDGFRALYAEWLQDHEVHTAADGDEALERFDRSVDVAFLDRDMPDPSGVDLATELHERVPECHIVLVSSMPADFDIVDVPIDEYLQKPVDRTDLTDVLSEYETKRSYREALEEYFALTSKLAAIEAQRPAAELERDERYTDLRERAASKRAEVDAALREAESDWSMAFKSFGPDPAEVGRPNV